MVNIFDSYPGGKGNCYQQIINQIPPHATYIEGFLGGGAVFRRKRPALINIGIDADPTVIKAWSRADIVKSDDKTRYEFLCTNVLDWLGSHSFDGTEFVYLDPPYMDVPNYYAVPFTENNHRELLFLIRSLPTHVAISGYKSDLYQRILHDWRLVTFTAVTRSGDTATEHLWMNYELPRHLHDYKFLGENFRERERINRKRSRWIDGFRDLPQLEQRAILEDLHNEGIIPYVNPLWYKHPSSRQSAEASSETAMVQATTVETESLFKTWMRKKRYDREYPATVLSCMKHMKGEYHWQLFLDFARDQKFDIDEHFLEQLIDQLYWKTARAPAAEQHKFFLEDIAKSDDAR